MNKRPRISDNDPLNRTQKALERFPSNQPSSQLVDNRTSEEDNNIIDNPTSTSPTFKPTSLKVNKSAIEQESLTDESASGQVSNISSQQVLELPKDSNFTTAHSRTTSQLVDNRTSEEDNNIVDTPTSTSTSSPAPESTSLKVNKSTIEQESLIEESASKLVETFPSQQSTETSEDSNFTPSQQVNNITSGQDDNSPDPTISKPPSQLVGKSSSQQEAPPIVELKKATFQLDKAVLTKLEKFVLSLQLDLGKEKAPYKEIVVEEAIELFLLNDPSLILKALERRQKKRKK